MEQSGYSRLALDILLMLSPTKKRSAAPGQYDPPSAGASTLTPKQRRRRAGCCALRVPPNSTGADAPVTSQFRMVVPWPQAVPVDPNELMNRLGAETGCDLDTWTSYAGTNQEFYLQERRQDAERRPVFKQWV